MMLTKQEADLVDMTLKKEISASMASLLLKKHHGYAKEDESKDQPPDSGPKTEEITDDDSDLDATRKFNNIIKLR